MELSTSSTASLFARAAVGLHFAPQQGTVELPSQSILARVAAGDRQAVRDCVDAYGGLLWSMSLRMVPSRSDAEDAVQEIFIELWKAAARFDPEVASERTFVAMVARRRLIDRLRASKRRPAKVPLEEDLAADDTHRSIERSAEASVAAEVLGTLPPQQRKALELALGKGLTHREVAEAMDIPLGTAKSHVRKALAEVRRRLKVPRASRSAS